jgi:DNA-binding transcriptional ArsR family regulator
VPRDGEAELAQYIHLYAAVAASVPVAPGIAGAPGMAGEADAPGTPDRGSRLHVANPAGGHGLLTSSSSDGKLANMLTAAAIKALANERRLEILAWLKDPRAHFPPQVDGDLIRDGVCSLFIAQKLGVSPSTASEHLRILSQAGLVRGKRIKQWTFYRRDEKRIAEIKRELASAW